MLKRLSIISIVCVLLVSLSAVSASAAANGSNVFVDGQPLSSKSINRNGESFVPFREVFEKLNINIGYDKKSGQTTGTADQLKVTFKVGSKTAYVNGKKKALKAAPFTRNGTTYIPLQFVGGMTGYTANYSSKVNGILITSPSFGGASYSVEGIDVFFTSYGTVEVGLKAEEELNMMRELAEIKLENNAAKNSPKYRVIGEPPTAEQSKDPGYKGYPDYFDANYVAAVDNNEKLPPLMSEGWISLAMLSEIEKIVNLGSGDKNKLSIGKYVGTEVVRYDIPLTDEYKNAKEGDFVLGDLRVKKYKNIMYMNIEDLKKVGLIGSEIEQEERFELS